MTEADAVEILLLLKAHNLAVWIDGGWGVDALLGHQSRAHNDIDLVVEERDAERLTATLETAGFHRSEGGRPFNFVMTDGRGRQVDVHVVVLDAAGNGLYGPQPDDGTGLTYPAGALTGEGLIGGLGVRCLTADYQIHNRRAVPDERDIQDVRALQDRRDAQPTNDAIALVQRGYDAIYSRYSAWADRVDPPLRLQYVERVLAMAGSSVSRTVELGCGPGLPVGRYLAQRSAYVGVDLSASMLRQAAVNVPNGIFLQADMTTIAFAEASIDLVAALYSIIHVPRERHLSLFRSIARWLRPGGWLLASLGTRDNPSAIEDDWLGAPMFWSGFDADTNRLLLEDAGFELAESSIVDQTELGKPVQFLWVIAQRRARDAEAARHLEPR